MRVWAARAVIAVVAVGLLVVAAVGLNWGYALLTMDDPEGGAQVFGLFIFPGSLLAGLVGVGLFALAIHR